MVPRNSRAAWLNDSSWSNSVSTYPLIEVSGVLNSCDTLATKSRCVRSTSSMRVMSCSTATAPPAGMGDAFTSKMRPGISDVVLRSQTKRSSSAARTHASTSGSRTVCTNAWPTRTELATAGPGIIRCIAWFAHWIRPAASTATTASCIESSSASNSCLLSDTIVNAPSVLVAALAIAPARPSKSLNRCNSSPSRAGIRSGIFSASVCSGNSDLRTNCAIPKAITANNASTPASPKIAISAPSQCAVSIATTIAIGSNASAIRRKHARNRLRLMLPRPRI